MNPWQPTNIRWRIVGILLAFSFMSWFNRVSIGVAYVGQIKNELDISEEAIGVVYSVFLISYMVCMTPGGWLADRFGPWLALVVMGIGSGVFGILTGSVDLVTHSAAQGLLLFLIVRTIMGVFTAPIYPASTRLVSYWIPFHQRAMVNGLIMAAALVGIASSYQVFGRLVDWFRWPMAFAITGTFTIILALLWAWYGKNHPEQHRGVNPAEDQWIRQRESAGAHERASARAQSGEEHITTVPALLRSGNDESITSARALLRSRDPTLWRNRSLILLTLSYAAVGYFEYLFYFWIQYYFKEVLKLGEDQGRWFATISNLSMAAGMASGGLISDRLQRIYGYRLGRALVPVGGMLAGAALLGLGLLAEEANWIVFWFSLAMAAVGATEGPFWATAIDLGGKNAATSAGIFNTGGNAGGAIAPILTPIVSKAWGWEWGIGLGSLVCLTGVCFWWWIDPAEGRESLEAPIGTG
jgi:MFS family permease